jgi:hypothetical protein
VSLENAAYTRTARFAAQRTRFTLIRGSRNHGSVVDACLLPYSSLYLVTSRAPRAAHEKLLF